MCPKTGWAQVFSACWTFIFKVRSRSPEPDCFLQPTGANSWAPRSICLTWLGGTDGSRSVAATWTDCVIRVHDRCSFWPSLSAAGVSVIRSGNDPCCCERRNVRVCQVAMPGLLKFPCIFLRPSVVCSAEAGKLRQCHTFQFYGVVKLSRVYVSLTVAPQWPHVTVWLQDSNHSLTG